MVLTKKQLKVLQFILKFYIPTAAPYISEEVLDEAEKLQIAINEALEDE